MAGVGFTLWVIDLQMIEGLLGGVVLYRVTLCSPMKRCYFPFACLALGLLAPVHAQLPSISSDRVSLKIIQTDEAAFPETLRGSAVLEGEAWVAINVDNKGKLVDYLVIGYSRKEFADTTVAALQRWQYEPARLHGEPWPSIQEVHFSYSRTGVVIFLSVYDGFTARLDEFAKGLYSYRTFALRELDRIPTPIQVVSPATPTVGSKQEKRTVTVEFYIDQEGRVRLPAVAREEADDVYAANAMAAVRQWRFEPPLYKGRPVVVIAKQQFNFMPKPESKEQK